MWMLLFKKQSFDMCAELLGKNSIQAKSFESLELTFVSMLQKSYHIDTTLVHLTKMLLLRTNMLPCQD